MNDSNHYCKPRNWTLIKLDGSSVRSNQLLLWCVIWKTMHFTYTSIPSLASKFQQNKSLNCKPDLGCYTHTFPFFFSKTTLIRIPMLDNGYFKDSNFFIFFYVNFCGEVHVAVLHWLKAQLRLPSVPKSYLL